MTMKQKRSATPGKVPLVGDLADGQIALNTADGLLFVKKADNSVIRIGAEMSAPVATTLKAGNLPDFRAAIGLGSLSTLTPTGTPTGAKFLRDDGAWGEVSQGFRHHATGALSGASVIVSGLGGFRDIMVMLLAAVASVGAYREVRVGNAGGIKIGTIYQIYAAAYSEMYLSSQIAQARSECLIVRNFNTTDAVKPCALSGGYANTATPPIAILATDPLDRIEILSSAGTFTDGAYHIWGR